MAIATLSLLGAQCLALADGVVWVWQALGKQHDCEGCDLIGGVSNMHKLLRRFTMACADKICWEAGCKPFRSLLRGRAAPVHSTCIVSFRVCSNSCGYTVLAQIEFVTATGFMTCEKYIHKHLSLLIG